MTGEEAAAVELLARVLGATLIDEPRCQDCGAGGVRYDAPADAAGVSCREHVRRLPTAPAPPGPCDECGDRNHGHGHGHVAFSVREPSGRLLVRRYCPEHRPPRTPGGTPWQR